jgi:hypothetical protein
MEGHNLSEERSDNPYYPWSHEGELWLSDFLYRKGHVSMNASDKLLRQFANGNITMKGGPIQFRNTRQMHDVLDIAAGDNVVSLNLMHAGTCRHCSCS